MVDASTTPSPPPLPPPVLDLDTLIVRPIVRIDGATYELRTAEDLSVLENRRLFLLSKRIEAFEALPHPSDAEAAEYRETLGVICRKVLVAPDGELAAARARTTMPVLRLRTARTMFGRMGRWLRRIASGGRGATATLAPAIERLTTPQRGAVVVTFSHLWLESLLRTTRVIRDLAEAANAKAETTGAP